MVGKTEVDLARPYRNLLAVSLASCSAPHLVAFVDSSSVPTRASVAVVQGL